MQEQYIKLDQQVLDGIQRYRLPRYHEIPDVGLYLNQVVKYINGYLEPFADSTITESMISNYVKKHLVESPEKKQYNRVQISYLMFIAITKSVLSLENIQKMILLQNKTYETSVAYNYFCDAFEKELCKVFDVGEVKEQRKVVDSPEIVEDVVKEAVDSDDSLKLMFRTIIVTLAHKCYLDYIFLSL